MRIFTAGWVLVQPQLNFFKRLIRANESLSLAGIIYPKKIPSDIEGIPVLSFDDAANVVTAQDTVIEVSMNGRMAEDFKAFFGELGVPMVGLSEFIGQAIAEDSEDLLQLPFAEVCASDVRRLQASKPPHLIDDAFFDLESFRVAQQLDAAFRVSDWGRFCDFDRDDTPDEALCRSLQEFHQAGMFKRFLIVDSPRIFLNALLQLKIRDPLAAFEIELTPQALTELGTRTEFYRRSLDGALEVDGASRPANEPIVTLSGSAAPVAARLQSASVGHAVFFMRRSILDLPVIQAALGSRPHRLMLRQPDTKPENLLAVVLAS